MQVLNGGLLTSSATCDGVNSIRFWGSDIRKFTQAMSSTLDFSSKKCDILIFISLNSLSSRRLTQNLKECYLFGLLSPPPPRSNKSCETRPYIIIRKGECDKYHKCDLTPLRFFSSPFKACYQYRKGVPFEMLNIYRNGGRLATFHLLSAVS